MHWLTLNDRYGAISCWVVPKKLSAFSWRRDLCNDVFSFKIGSKLISNKARKRTWPFGRHSRIYLHRLRSQPRSRCPIPAAWNYFAIHLFKPAITCLLDRRFNQLSHGCKTVKCETTYTCMNKGCFQLFCEKKPRGSFLHNSMLAQWILQWHKNSSSLCWCELSSTSGRKKAIDGGRRPPQSLAGMQAACHWRRVNFGWFWRRILNCTCFSFCAL